MSIWVRKKKKQEVKTHNFAIPIDSTLPNSHTHKLQYSINAIVSNNIYIFNCIFVPILISERHRISDIRFFFYCYGETVSVFLYDFGA